jgi:hypothetical protein
MIKKRGAEFLRATEYALRNGDPRGEMVRTCLPIGIQGNFQKPYRDLGYPYCEMGG